MRYPVVQKLSHQHSVSSICSALGVSRSGFYSWIKQTDSLRRREDRRLKVEIRSIFRESHQTYGSPRMRVELRDRGFCCSRKRVARLMREEGLVARARKRYRTTTQSAHRFAVAPNRLQRRFQVETPDAVWLGDITYIWTQEGWLFLAALMDLCTRRIVGWAVDERLTQGLTRRALNRAIETRQPAAGLLHHTDQGKQYAANDYRERLEATGIHVSMSRRGDCFDNAPMESFFSTLKTERVHRRRYATRREAHRDLFEYIEVFYNRKRRHSAIGDVAPAEYDRRRKAA